MKDTLPLNRLDDSLASVAFSPHEISPFVIFSPLLYMLIEFVPLLSCLHDGPAASCLPFPPFFYSHLSFSPPPPPFFSHSSSSSHYFFVSGGHNAPLRVFSRSLVLFFLFRSVVSSTCFSSFFGTRLLLFLVFSRTRIPTPFFSLPSPCERMELAVRAPIVSSLLPCKRIFLLSAAMPEMIVRCPLPSPCP